MRCPDPYNRIIEDELKKYLADAEILPSLRACMSYSVEAGGKRLRPSMLLASCEMLGGDIQPALPLACAIEMIHTYSLIHDDLPCMDNDDLRRGKPTNHKVFGEGTAVLAGDGLLSYAFEIMTEALLKWQAQIPSYALSLREIARGAGIRGMVAGQMSDLENEKAPQHTARALYYIHSHKTGAMLKAAVLAGAYAAGACENEISALGEFGEQYGLLFQITDDILDHEGEAALLGKSTGKDEISGKLTYVTLYGVDKAKEMARGTMEKARRALEAFGGKAVYFNELLDYSYARNN